MQNQTALPPTPSTARGSYTTLIECICILAVADNCLLLYVFIRCPLKAGATYKAFFILTIVQDLVFAISFFLTVPLPVSFDWTFMLIATGRLGDSLNVCRPGLAVVYTSGIWLTVIVATNTGLVVNWALMNVLCGWPTVKLIMLIREWVLENYHFNIFGATFSAVSIKYALTTSTYALLVEALVMVLFVGAVGFLCAVRIHFTLKHTAMSAQTKRMHRQMLRLLLLQTLCPLILLHAPLYKMYALLFSGSTSSNALSYAIGILMSLFPFVCPLITILFMKDYRRFIFRKVMHRKQAEDGATTIRVKNCSWNGPSS